MAEEVVEQERGPGGEWLRMMDALVSGIHHALNNRTTALAAVAQVLEQEVPAESPMSGLFTQEMERMRVTVGLLGHLARGRTSHPEPLQVADAAADARALYGMHPDLREVPLEVEVDPNVLPVWADRAYLLRALVLLLASAAADARMREEATVHVRIGGDQERLWVVVTAAEVSDIPSEGLSELHAGDSGAVQEAAAWVAGAGGRLDIETGTRGRTYRVELPTLLVVRRGDG